MLNRPTSFNLDLLFDVKPYGALQTVGEGVARPRPLPKSSRVPPPKRPSGPNIGRRQGQRIPRSRLN